MTAHAQNDESRLNSKISTEHFERFVEEAKPDFDVLYPNGDIELRVKDVWNANTEELAEKTITLVQKYQTPVYFKEDDDVAVWVTPETSLEEFSEQYTCARDNETVYALGTTMTRKEYRELCAPEVAYDYEHDSPEFDR